MATLDMFDETTVEAPDFVTIAKGDCKAADLDDDLLRNFIQYAERQYRAGTPVISDDRFDHEFMAELIKRNPDDDLVDQVGEESEEDFAAEKVAHPKPMLSTEKAYTADERQSWINRVIKEAKSVGVDRKNLIIRVTPKLDGLAGRDDGKVLATRGDGHYGFDVSRVFDRGVVPVGGRGLGLGELVLDKNYFEQHLKDEFSHSRNVMVGIVKADDLGDHAIQASEDGAARFVPYSTLPAWEGNVDEFLDAADDIRVELLNELPYDTDGLVAQVENPAVQEAMGATNHHYRWMLALKEKGETADTVVKDIIWQTGRTGRVTPVLLVETVNLSGANINRVTAHHARMIESLGIGVGAKIKIIRSGEVIPKIEEILEPVDNAVAATECPCCGHELEWDGDYRSCPNTLGCSAQVSTGLIHFFKTLGNIDLFGPKTIEVLVDAGIKQLPEIYQLKAADFERLGFGPGQSANLERELVRSLNETVDDWRFLAAFGIRHLGRGDSRKLLTAFVLEGLSQKTAADIQSVEGFGPITSESIAGQIQERFDLIRAMLGLGFNLRRSGKAVAGKQRREVPDSPIAGKGVVFTGSMQSGSREDMQEQARNLGANVQSGVSGKTDYLVCGAKVGAAKMTKAEKVGAKVISEDEYLQMISA